MLGSNSGKGIPTTLRTLRLPLNEISEQCAAHIQQSAESRADAPLFPAEFDLVCTGGGLAAFYGGMVSSVLGSLKRRGVMRVDRLYGVSSGALVCACYLGCEAGHTKPVDVYRFYQVFVQQEWLSTAMRQVLDEILPPNVHELADGRLHVTVLEFGRGLLPTRRNISHFPTRDSLLDTIMASTIIPHVTLLSRWHPHGEPDGILWMDGTYVLAPPASSTSPQLFIDQGAVIERLGYPKSWVVQTKDDIFDATLSLPGIKDLARLMADGDELPNGCMRFESGFEPEWDDWDTAKPNPWM